MEPLLGSSGFFPCKQLIAGLEEQGISSPQSPRRCTSLPGYAGPASSLLPPGTQGLSMDSLFLLGLNSTPTPFCFSSWGAFCPRMCLCGCVCEVAGNCGGESPRKLAGPQGHHAGDEGAGSCRGRWDFMFRGPQGKAESKSCAGGGSQPLAPLSLLHFNGGGGRRGTSAGTPMSPRRGQLMQGGGTAPGPSCFPFLSVV